MRGHREGSSQRVTFTQRSKEANHVTIWEKNQSKQRNVLGMCEKQQKDGYGCAWREVWVGQECRKG